MDFLFSFFEQFQPISAEARDLILTATDKIQVRKGSILVEEGKPNPYMYLIRKGLARDYFTIGKEEITTTLWKENETFGDVTTYITGGPAVKSYQLLEDSELYRINNAAFRALFPLSHEVCNLGRLILENYILHQGSLNQKFFRLSAKEKYETFLLNRPGLIYRVKFIYIASFLRITPETLSRIHSKKLKSDHLPPL